MNVKILNKTDEQKFKEEVEEYKQHTRILSSIEMELRLKIKELTKENERLKKKVNDLIVEFTL